jgi:aspartyl-tRNA(Asn)/glutamyl-tRNA(Gln) amidotransferase subunit C
MTQISRDAVVRLALLSSLELEESEIESLQKDIGEILGYVEQLNELNTDGVEPAYQVTGLENVFRDDVVEHTEGQREVLLKLAPETTENQIKVPKVLSK